MAAVQSVFDRALRQRQLRPWQLMGTALAVAALAFMILTLSARAAAPVVHTTGEGGQYYSAPQAGGQIEIEGENFTGVTGVTFGGVQGTNFQVQDDNTISVTVPAGIGAGFGDFDLVLQHPDGPVVIENGFSYEPTIDSVHVPDLGEHVRSGPQAGGTTLVITGTGFTENVTVWFAAGWEAFEEALDVTFESETEITVTTPPGLGNVDVIVANVNAEAVFENGFSYDPVIDELHVVGDIESESGPVGGGTEVEITGAGFAEGIRVYFVPRDLIWDVFDEGGCLGESCVWPEGTEGTAVVIVDDTTLRVTTPPADAVGFMSVVVAYDNRDAWAILEDGFIYVPTIESISPAFGPQGGGTEITITGTGFTGVTGVFFGMEGGEAGTELEVVNDTTIRVTTPAGAGDADVSVWNEDAEIDEFEPRVYAFVEAGFSYEPVIESLNVTSGPRAGDTHIVITGTGFWDATSVTFNGVPGTQFTVVSDTIIGVVTPPGVGDADVVVSNTNASATRTAGFSYIPSITSLDVTSGSPEGGTEVFISGVGFVDASEVTFGGVAAQIVEILDGEGEAIHVITPAGSGLVDVVVRNTHASVTLADAFRFISVDSVTPAFGPQDVITPVTITGAGFTGATGVLFDGVELLAGFEVVDDQTITITAPPGTGDVDVTVVTPTINTTLENGFSYTPVITSVHVNGSPDVHSGPQAGGTTVDINGTGLQGVTVTFGGVEPTVLFADDILIRITTPPGTGDVDVVVSNVNAEATAVDAFSYEPVISGLSVTSGPQAGGTHVIITGSGLAGVATVTFGGELGTDLNVGSNGNFLSVRTPAGTGNADVVVSNANASVTEADGFSYTPTITSLDVTSGSLAGGTAVTITGTGFTDATSVTFHGHAGDDLVVVGDTELTVTTPAGTGTVDVVVFNANSSATLANAFSYTPTIDSLDVTSGSLAGGTVVTITGEGFTDATAVTFGGIAGTNLTISDETITVTTPAAGDDVTGRVDVVVTNLHSSATFANGFSYMVPEHRTPLFGAQAGGTTVTITGYGFDDVTEVTFGGEPGGGLNIVSDTEITVTTPAGTGTVDVVVATATTSATRANWFSYQPTVDSLDVTSGPLAGGTEVVISGTGFADVTRVDFGNVNFFEGDGADNFSRDGDTITLVTPSGQGTVNVTVFNHNSSETLDNAFSYEPTIASLDVTSGPLAGGTAVTITGEGFTDATEVTFDGDPGDDLVVVSDTEITITTPAGTGTVDVVVSNLHASATREAGFSYREITGLEVQAEPGLQAGPQDGGTVVTITGVGFLGATEATFGGVAGTNFTVDGDETITVTTPAGAGTVDVAVLTSATSTTLADGFSYEPTIESLSVTSGSPDGGTVVTLTGAGFTHATGVTFDGVAGTDFSVDDGETITVTTPAAGLDVTGLVDVVVSNLHASATLEHGFSYMVIESLDPASGPQAGGTEVTITGVGFDDVTGLTLGGIAIAGDDFTVVDDSTITMTTPSGTGQVDVMVSTGTTSATLPNGFSYTAPPPVVVPPSTETQPPAQDPPPGTPDVTRVNEVESPPAAVDAPVTVQTSSTEGSSVVVTAPANTLPPGATLRAAAIDDVDELIAQAAPPETAAVTLAFVLEAVSADGTAIVSFDQPLSLEFVLPASAAPQGATPDTLSLAFWDGSEWVSVDGTVTRNQDGSFTVSATVDHFTVFGLLHHSNRGLFMPAPSAQGISMALWGGGGYSLMDTHLSSGQSVWVTVDGKFFGYVAGVPAIVNAGFLAQFPTGLSEGTPVLVSRPVPPN